MSNERIRIACCDASGVVIDLIVVEDFLGFVESSTALIEARWPGGVYALADHDPDRSVSLGWTRVGGSGGAWQAPVVPRDEKIAAINAQTSRAIDAGFTFRGRRFSLSLASQITISNAYTIRASLPYPLRWADADDTGFVVMESAADIEAFYQAATLAVLVARSTGNAAKAAVIETEKG